MNGDNGYIHRIRENEKINNLINSTHEMIRHTKTHCDVLLRHYHVYDGINEVIRYFAKHPMLALALLAVVGVCAIPVTLFVLFVIGTLVLTVGGFIVIEGTLITIGTVFLCGCLLSIWIVLLTIGGFTAVAYFGFMRMYSVMSPETMLGTPKQVPTPMSNPETENSTRRDKTD